MTWSIPDPNEQPAVPTVRERTAPAEYVAPLPPLPAPRIGAVDGAERSPEPVSSTGGAPGPQGWSQPSSAPHLAYPVNPYVQAPYTPARAENPGGQLTLSIVALCLSGGSFLVALIPVLQFVWWMVGIAGIVCGFIALRRELRGRTLAITAIVLGFISVFGLLLLIVLALLFFGGIGLLGAFSAY